MPDPEPQPAALLVAAPEGHPRPATTAVLWAFTALFAAVVGANLVAASYSRFVADDFLLAVRVREYGVVGAAAWFYHNWTGRYSAIFLGDIAYALSPSARCGWYPAVLIASWVAATFGCARFRFDKLSALCLALGVPAVTLLLAPNVFESAYWVAGSSCYLAAVVGLTAATALMISSRTLLRTAACCAACVGVAGIHEAAALILPTVVLSLMVVRGIQPKRGTLILAASVAGLLLVATAPGNRVRQSSFTHHVTLAFAATSSSLDMQAFLSQTATMAVTHDAPLAPLHPPGSGWALLSLAAIAALIASRSQVNISPKLLLCALICGLYAMWVSFFVCRYGTGSPIPDRSVIIPVLALVALTAMIGFYTGQLLRSTRAERAAIVLSLVCAALASTPIASNFARPAAMRSFAAGWDSEASRIQRGGAITKTYANPGNPGSEYTSWQVTAERQFYGRRE
ncbi:MAG TPA: hypothetical protein VGK19_07995 [Capsulimonadaceae bacterium]